ncbi:MAG: hypothetical protein ACLFUS_15995 [Candidatus Sumerlaeia bacterium]
MRPTDTPFDKQAVPLEVRRRINAIFKAVNERGLSIAFPARTLYVPRDPEGERVFERGE